MERIAESAARVCDANDAVIFRKDGDVLRVAASYGPLGPTETARTQGLPISRGRMTGRAIVDRQTVHVRDAVAAMETDFPEMKPFQKEIGFRTALATPLLSNEVAVGVIFIRRTVVNPFTDKQIAMLETFADQAVIAIENTRLFEAEQARTRS